MVKIISIVLFILGGLFFNASHIPAWWLRADKPTQHYWKLYGAIGVLLWILLLIIINLN